MTDDQENASENPSSKDRLEEIKQEAQEDASSYYAQGKSEGDAMTEEDFTKPVPRVNEEKEEMNLMKALAYLGFGMGALAIIIILFFLRNLDTKVGDVDAAVGTLEQKFGPLKQQVDESMAKVNADVSDLKNRFGNFERQAAVTELKRALVAIQTVTENTSPDVRVKSDQVIASIENLLSELGAGSSTSGASSMGMAPAPASAAAAPMAEEKPFEIILQQPASEPAPMAETMAENEAPAELVVEEAAPAEPEKPASEEPSGGDEGADDEEEEEEEEEDE